MFCLIFTILFVFEQLCNNRSLLCNEIFSHSRGLMALLSQLCRSSVAALLQLYCFFLEARPGRNTSSAQALKRSRSRARSRSLGQLTSAPLRSDPLHSLAQQQQQQQQQQLLLLLLLLLKYDYRRCMLLCSKFTRTTFPH